ncbi:MAG: hypothetical protein IJD28_07625, partial [Deferribacterales bacterium]|nr:hypothetical protein [Deferribacterales bacterium]
GASTGVFEAVELRDGNNKRYFGKEVWGAASNVNTEIADAIIGMNVFDPPFAVIESNLAFNTGAGVIVPLNDTWLLDFGFRYMQSNINFHVEGTQKVKNHNFYIGCLRKF